MPKPHDAPPADPAADPVQTLYRPLMAALNQHGVPFLVGGTYGFTHFTGIARPTKDLDIFVRHDDWERLVTAAARHGWRTELTHPHWLGKVVAPDGFFVDVIFSSGNGLSPVDDEWFAHAPAATVMGMPAALVPVEESLWTKAFIMERERYDGADVAHLLQTCAPSIDWARLLRRFGAHWRVLLSHLVLFGFVYPGERTRVPGWVMEELLARLHAERGPAAPDAARCQGTLLSREQYLPDVFEHGYADARLAPEGALTPQQVADWTPGALIAAEAEPPPAPGAAPAAAPTAVRGALRGRIAVVTGSDSGIGQAIAEAFAEEGADVVVTWRTDRDGAEDTRRRVEAQGRRALLQPLDVADPASVAALFDATVATLGVPDILVNNAGVDSTGTPVADLPDADFDRTLKVNLYGPFHCCRQFVRQRRAAGGGGRIVNVTSVHQEIPRAGGAAYDASKGGLRNLTRALALECAPLRITVNNLAPGMVLTPMNQAAIDDPALRAEQVRHIPWQRAGEPREVARLAVYLASDDADYATGQTFTLDGGLSLTLGQGA